ATTARPPQPRHPDPVTDGEPLRPGTARLDAPDDLVAGHGPGSARGEVALGQVQVGAAHTARLHPDPDLTGSGLRHRQLDRLQRSGRHRAGTGHHPGTHVGSPPTHAWAGTRSLTPLWWISVSGPG